MIGSSQLGSTGAALGEIELGSLGDGGGGGGGPNIIDKTLTDTLTATDSYSYELVSGSGLSWTLTQHVFITDSFSYVKITKKFFNLTDNLTATDSFNYLYFNTVLTDLLPITSSFYTVKNGSNIFADTLIINDYFTIAGNYAHIMTDIIDLSRNSFVNTVDNLIINVPSWYYIKTSKDGFNPFLYMYSENSSIFLESPRFGDIQANVNNVVINRTIGGSRYSYVKTSKRRHLKYEFNLRCGKVDELKTFLDSIIIEWITLINWKYETWLVRIVNDPIEIKAVSRDLYSVVLEFEGYRTVSGDYRCLE